MLSGEVGEDWFKSMLEFHACPLFFVRINDTGDLEPDGYYLIREKGEHIFDPTDWIIVLFLRSYLGFALIHGPAANHAS